MRLTLETQRLILRPFDTSDASDMFNGWASDLDVTKYLTWNTHKTVEDTRQILAIWEAQYDKPERLNFAITLKKDQTLIGGIDVVGYLDKVPVIGYNLSKKYWNNGYMTEAVKCLLNYLFSIGHNKVIIDAIVENIASNRVILKCGGIFQYTYKEFFQQKNKAFNINRYIVEKGE